MKKYQIRQYFAILLLMLCVMFTCSGCMLFIFADRGDWYSEPLVEDYVIIQTSHNYVVLGKGENPWETVVDATIIAVAWNDAYICVQQTDPPENGHSFPVEPIVYYYIVSVADVAVYGPLAEHEWEIQREALDLGTLCPWTDVQSLPRVGA